MGEAVTCPILTGPQRYRNALTYNVKGETTLWFYVPLIFWGVGVLVHYLQAIALFDDWWRTDESAVAEYLDVQEREG